MGPTPRIYYDGDFDLSFYDFIYDFLVNAHDTDFKNLDIIDIILTQIRNWNKASFTII